MRRLILIFAALIAIAVVSTALAILVSSGGGGGSFRLAWRIAGPIPDYDAGTTFLLPGQERPESVASVYSALTKARTDDRVRGLSVFIQQASFGLAKATQFRRLLEAVSERGKPVDCYLETAGEGGNGTLAYFLASACDSISLAPAGEINLLGLYVDRMFLRGSLDKLKVDAEFFRVGEYKSAVETYTEYENSPAAEEAVAAVLDDFYASILDAISEARGVPSEELLAIVDSAPHSADEALSFGLVDHLEYPDEFRARTEGGPELLWLTDYEAGPHADSQSVAVVFAQGTIVRGRSGYDAWTQEPILGAESFSALLSELRDDASVAAVVLRIDSPGGSALASDLILREVELLSGVKPVVVSMSDVAASGGYYIAAKADVIVAEATSLTGSIGVFGGKLVTRRFQEEMLGISHDTLKRGANADLYSSVEQLTAEQAAEVQGLMQVVYDRFVDHVATGRDMEFEVVNAVARGRVWTGVRALDLGLVDEIGGIERAVEIARTAAGLEPDDTAALEFYPRPASWLDLFSGGPGFSVARDLAPYLELLSGNQQRLRLPPDLAALRQPF